MESNEYPISSPFLASRDEQNSYRKNKFDTNLQPKVDHNNQSFLQQQLEISGPGSGPGIASLSSSRRPRPQEPLSKQKDDSRLRHSPENEKLNDPSPVSAPTDTLRLPPWHNVGADNDADTDTTDPARIPLSTGAPTHAQSNSSHVTVGLPGQSESHNDTSNLKIDRQLSPPQLCSSVSLSSSSSSLSPRAQNVSSDSVDSHGVSSDEMDDTPGHGCGKGALPSRFLSASDDKESALLSFSLSDIDGHYGGPGDSWRATAMTESTSVDDSFTLIQRYYEAPVG